MYPYLADFLKQFVSKSDVSHRCQSALRLLRCEPLEDRRMLSNMLFVDHDAASGGDGLSWSTAYDDLQDALSQSEILNSDGDNTNDVEQIWIAEGVYKPSTELEPGNPRSANFSLLDGVTLYGGFLGTETSLSQRDWSNYHTILSGDIGTLGSFSDNVYTVVYVDLALGQTATLDGLTITGGKADGSYGLTYQGSGGGIFSTGDGTLNMSNITLSENLANSAGGAICNMSGDLWVSNSTLSGNSAPEGGGIFTDSGTLWVTESTLSENTAFDDYGYGNGGGISIGESGTLHIENSTLSENEAFMSGGAIYNVSADATVIGTTFNRNSVWGSSSYHYYHSGGGAIYNYGGGSFALDSSRIIGCSAGYEIFAADGGAIYNRGASLTLTNTELIGNAVYLGGRGGGIYNYFGTMNIHNSTLIGNWNEYGPGGGVYNNNGTMTIANSTLSENSSTDEGGGIVIDSSSSVAILNNTIVAGNSAPNGPDIHHSSGTLSGSYNLIGEGTGQSALVHGVDGNQVGTSSSPIDPMLSDIGLLLLGSPAIDAGSNALALDPQGNPLTTDLDGNARIINGTVDMGAYEYCEFCLEGDLNDDGFVGGNDLDIVRANWGQNVTAGDLLAGDPSGDGFVGGDDLDIVRANWGQGTPPMPVAKDTGDAATEPIAEEKKLETIVYGPRLPEVKDHRRATILGPRLAEAHDEAILDLLPGTKFNQNALLKLAWAHEFEQMRLRRAVKQDKDAGVLPVGDARSYLVEESVWFSW